MPISWKEIVKNVETRFICLWTPKNRTSFSVIFLTQKLSLPELLSTMHNFVEDLRLEAGSTA